MEEEEGDYDTAGYRQALPVSEINFISPLMYVNFNPEYKRDNSCSVSPKRESGDKVAERKQHLTRSHQLRKCVCKSVLFTIFLDQKILTNIA